MAVLQTDRSYRLPDSETTWIQCKAGTVYPPSVSLNTVKCLGTIKYFSGSRDGYFVPGIFRANPVAISEARGSIELSRVVTRCAGFSVNDWCAVFEGPLASLGFVTWEQGFGKCVYNQSLADYTLVKAYSKLKEVELDVATNLGELRDTLEFVKNPLKGLINALRKPAKRGGKGKKIADVLSTGWMQYRYALMPILNDVASAMELLRKKQAGLRQFIRKRGSYKSPVTETRTNSAIAGPNFFADLQVTEQLFVKSQTVLCVEMLWHNDAWNMLKALGLSPDRGLEVAWELTKLSFVVDWFARVGDWLSAMVPAIDATVKGGSTSQVCTYKRTAIPFNFRPNGNGLLNEVRSGKGEWFFSALNRKVNEPRPYLPPLNPNWLNLKRSLDSACLLHNVASNLLSKSTRRK